MTPDSDPLSSAKQTLMRQETLEAPQVVRRQLAANLDACKDLATRYASAKPRLVMTCARGSSDHAATYAKYLIEVTLGVPVLSAAPSVGSIYQTRMDLKGCAVVCISQSGASPDLVTNAQWAASSGAFVVSLVNVVDSPLARASHMVLPLHAGPEKSVAATKSYISSLSALLQIVTHLSGDSKLLAALERLPDDLARAAALDWSAAAVPLASSDDLLVVGRGLSFAIAQEAALKLKETSAIHAEAFSGAELMHGPLALVRERYPILLFSQEDETRAGMRELTQTLRSKGARVFAAEEGEAEPFRLPIVPRMHRACAPIAMIQSYYGLANAISLARGFDPDRPPHLAKVTETR